MKTKIKYTLLEKSIPVIKKNSIVYDARVGGEKLIYQKTTTNFTTINIGKLFSIDIPLIFKMNKKGKISRNIIKEKIIFLRPYKNYWNKDGKRDKWLPFHQWGKKEHPLTNIWLEMLFDFTDIMKQTPVIKSCVDDPIIIKFLRQHEEEFTIINQN